MGASPERADHINALLHRGSHGERNSRGQSQMRKSREDSSQSRLLPATASAVGLVSFSLGSLESRAAARAAAVARKEQQSCLETGPLAALKSLPKLSTAESEVLMARIISARKRLGR
jgi:hypothetical protein